MGKHLCQRLFFNKVAGPETLSKKKLWHRCCPVNFVKFWRTPYLQNTSGRLLLRIARIKRHLTQVRWILSYRQNFTWNQQNPTQLNWVFFHINKMSLKEVYYPGKILHRQNVSPTCNITPDIINLSLHTSNDTSYTKIRTQIDFAPK